MTRPTISLLVARDALAEKRSFEGFAAAAIQADEVIEVSSEPSSAQSATTRYKWISPRIAGLTHSLNLGASFATGDWVVVAFGDEAFSREWTAELRSVVENFADAVIHVFHTESGSAPPVVAVRRPAFSYGAFDERFACARLAPLHWIHRIFPRPRRRVFDVERVSHHKGVVVAEYECPKMAGAAAALAELSDELDPSLRAALVRQSDTASAGAHRHAGAPAATQASHAAPDGGGYEARKFWEGNTTDYIRWEIYQPDEPEILDVVADLAPRRVIELGCGAGRNTRYFTAGDLYAGVDLSLNLLRRAAERQERNSIGIACADITTLPIADSSFDMVFADSTIQHVPPALIEQCVAEIVRVAADYICIIEYTEEESEAGEWFKQIHMFAHDYAALFAPYCDVVRRQDTSMSVHPARKELFIFRKRRTSQWN